MTKKSRYAILLVGFITFLILAPLIVLYVRGITYDFATNRFLSTGIFGVITEPKNADILLNGKKKRSSSGDINFVLPGEYQITVEKNGYQTWNKRLSVEAGQVTWANPANNSIYLLLNPTLQKTVSQNVLDYNFVNGYLFYITNDSFVLGEKKYPLPQNMNKILAYDNGAKNFVLTDGKNLLYFNSDSEKFIDLSALFPTLPKLQFGSGGNLYALNADILSKIDLHNLKTQPIFQNIQAFYYQDGNLYYIQEKAGSPSSLFVSEEPLVQSQLLLNNIPIFAQADLFITFEKRIFLFADKTLYQVNGSLQKIGDNVENLNFRQNNLPIVLSESGEFDYLDDYGGGVNFVTRSSEPFVGLAVKNSIGYGFYANTKNLTAIELDSRGSQNQYVLYSGENIQKFSVDDAGKNILVLDNGELKSVTIR